MTAQTMQIGNRPCRIYGEPHAEYLLLQMTGEHELQSMDHEVTVIAQSSWNFCLRLSQWKAGTMHFLRGKPLLYGENKVSAAMLRTPCASDGTGHSHAEAAVSSPGKR